MKVLAVDPGHEKSGVAVCVPGKVLARRVISSADLPDVVCDWIATYGVEVIVVGNRTGSADAQRRLEEATVPVVFVDEHRTTLRARARYFVEHPPRGWRRFLPRSLLVPEVPYDDYAAILLGEAYLATHGLEEG